ncbi:MAG: aspartate aminotransferase family protein [Caldithrix sp.]|nr:MAG: aspartate aminotransferase family protein [Caldithrix sp.]
MTINYLELEETYALGVYAKKELVLVKGRNARIWDKDGNEYIDCVSGNGVANLGHANEKIAQAVSEQAARLITCSNMFYNDQRALLLEKLIQITPANLNKTFLCSSGTESIEGAIKFAKVTTQKTEFVCAEKAFHGRTTGSLSATFKPEYKKGFEPLLPGFGFVPFNDFDSLKELVNQNTAGIILEVIQGEGGINIGNADYFQKVRQLCDEKGVILIIDEIQSGFCRTGKMFACYHFDLEPDILCVAKAIAGGLPMGAVVCSNKIDVPAGKHGTTFGGNPLCCAAANAAIDFMIENQLAEQAQEKGEYFTEKLKKNPLRKIQEIRGLGLMIGIELKGPAAPLISMLLEKGVLVFPAGANVIRVLPPLTITYEDLDFVIEKLVEVLN